MTKPLRKIAPADLPELKETVLKLIKDEGGVAPAARKLGGFKYSPQLSHMCSKTDQRAIPSAELADKIRLYARRWVGDGTWLRTIPEGVYAVTDLPPGTTIIGEPKQCPHCGRHFVGIRTWCPDASWATRAGQRYQRQRRKEQQHASEKEGDL